MKSPEQILSPNDAAFQAEEARVGVMLSVAVTALSAFGVTEVDSELAAYGLGAIGALAACKAVNFAKQARGYNRRISELSQEEYM
jgi:hypothetical protein